MNPLLSSTHWLTGNNVAATLFVAIAFLGLFFSLPATPANAGPGNCGDPNPPAECTADQIGEAREQAAQERAAAGAADAFSCNILNGWIGKGNLMNCMAHVANFFLWATGILLYYASMLFNFVMVETVIQMGRNINGIIGITVAWEVLRDIGNIIFVFALLFIGIGTILQVSSYSYKNLLRNVIIGALFINFSLLIGKVVIDVTNLAATSLYDLSTPNPTLCASSGMVTNEAIEECMNDGISGAFMQALDLTTLFSSSNAQGIFGFANISESAPNAAVKITVIGIFGSVLLVVTAFVLFAGAIMLAARFVILIFLLVFSPIAFAGMAFPKLKGYADDWWRKLFSQAFFAPVYLLMIYITLKIVERPVMADGNASARFVDALVGSASSFGIMVNFVIVIGLMITSLIVASRLGATGADAMMKWGKSTGLAITGGAVGGATFGLLAKTGRSTFGRLGYNRMDSERLKERASRGGVGGMVARMQLKSYQKMASSSYDARQASTLGVGKTLQSFNLGAGKKGGMKAQVESVRKTYEAIGKDLGEAVYNDDERARASSLDFDIVKERRRLAEYKTARMSAINAKDAARQRDAEAEISKAESTLKTLEGARANVQTSADARARARKDQYVQTLDKERQNRLLKAASFFTNRNASRAEAAAELRKGKTNMQKLQDAFKAASKDVAAEEAPAAGAAPAGGGGGTPAP